MQLQHPINIRKVANGFVVEPFMYSPNVARSDSDVRVFETMESLQSFISDHFNTSKPE